MFYHTSPHICKKCLAGQEGTGWAVGNFCLLSPRSGQCHVQYSPAARQQHTTYNLLQKQNNNKFELLCYSLPVPVKIRLVTCSTQGQKGEGGQSWKKLEFLFYIEL